jgi:hypothetical protein
VLLPRAWLTAVAAEITRWRAGHLHWPPQGAGPCACNQQVNNDNAPSTKLTMLAHCYCNHSGGGLGIYTGPRKVLGPGELFGEISFFTEIPQMENVRWVGMGSNPARPACC